MHSMTRRDFARLGASAVAVGAGIGRLNAEPLKLPIGLQLYSVREMLPKDFEGMLRKVREAGYTEVEAAGYYDKSAAEFKGVMSKWGLRCVSTHHPLGVLQPRLDELIEYGHELGLEYMICASSIRRDPDAKGPLDLDDWRWVAGEFNRIGEKVKAAGMTFGYHNHTPEFGTEGGVVFYDELLRLTDPKLVIFEMD
jgi:sugar phosphate isomerase/epimerase